MLLVVYYGYFWEEVEVGMEVVRREGGSKCCKNHFQNN